MEPVHETLMDERARFAAFIVGAENDDRSLMLATIAQYIDENIDSWKDDKLVEFVSDIWNHDSGQFHVNLNFPALKEFVRNGVGTTSTSTGKIMKEKKMMTSFLPRMLIGAIWRNQEGSEEREKLAASLASFSTTASASPPSSSSRTGVQSSPINLKPFSLFLNAFVLLVDISGFTRLSGSYCSRGKAGIDDLQKATNGYMGQLVKVIYKHGGDIIKFGE